MTDTEPAVKLQLMSHSRRSGWLRCANQLRLVKGGYPVPPGIAMFAGTAFHSCTDDVDHILLAGEEPTQAECADFWEAHFEAGVAKAREQEPDESKWRVSGRRSKDKPNKEDLAWWRMVGPGLVEAYVACRIAEITNGLDIWIMPNGEPAIELGWEFEILPGVMERGFIDRVLTQNEAFLIRDTKSGMVPKDHSQLGIYRVALQELHDINAWWGDYYMAKEGVPTDAVDLKHFTLDYFREQDRMVAGAMAAGIYPANPGMFCGNCEVRSACAAVGGVEADAWRFVLPR